MKRTHLSLAALVTLCLSLLLISGCGSSGGNKEGDGPVASVSQTQCAQCHSATKESLTGETIVAQYQNSSPHNSDAVGNCEACHGAGGAHNGIGPIPYPAPDAARCATCHDGTTAPVTNASTKFADSLHANMVLEESAKCQRCHTHEGALLSNIAGFTGDYNVLDNKSYQTIAIPPKGYSQFKCATCHEHGGGLRAVKARYNNLYNAADTANGAIVPWDANGNREVDQFDLCTSCHTYQSLRYATGVGTTQDFMLLASGTAANAATGKPQTGKVGYHETSWYRAIPTTHYDNPATGLSATDTALAPGNVIEGYNIRGATRTYTKTKSPCYDCHGHEAKAGTRYGKTTTPTIYTDWAQSKHAGGLLAAKYTAVTGKTGAASVDSAMISGVADAAGSTDYASTDASGAAITITRRTENGIAWSHYQWERTLKADGTADRGACQRCHTATGASNFLTNPATYDYKENDFTHLSGWVKATATAATVPSPQQEVLYCWGCHSNAASGVVRTPGAITTEYKFNGATAKLPDVGASNICISCHIGRESGESITAKADSTFNNLSFVNSHYMGVAGLMYVKIGFTAFIDPNTVIGTSTYGKSLTSTDDGGALSSTHRKLGTTAINGDSHNTAAFTPGNFDSNGPCVTCHMQATGQATRSTSHTFAINGNAFEQVCVKCHDEEGGVPLTAANFETLFLEEQAVPFEDALALALNQLLTKYNISYDQAAYPYFYDQNLAPVGAVKDWTRGGTLSNADAKKLMGACFNINLLKREPAAFVHARTYTRRLLYDTIDFLDDKTINMSVGATAIAYNPVKYVKGATATTGGTTESYKYLAGYSRSTGAWNTLQRP